MSQRVQKILSNSGFCSRREAERLIGLGKVKVNGKVITLGDKADPKKDSIDVMGRLVRSDKKIYIILNKPRGYISTLKDPQNRKTIVDLIDIKERIFPIGRLDLNTEGLILLTNDGDFANLVMHPRFNIQKTYIVRITEPIEKKHVEALRTGVDLIYGKTRPAKAKVLNKERTLVQITIHEGKNRILRRMFNELGYFVKELKRIRVGFLEQKGLKRGKWRYLNEKEVSRLRKMAMQSDQGLFSRLLSKIKKHN